MTSNSPPPPVVADTATETVADMAAYYAKRAAYYERVYFKPERQHELRALEAWLPAQFAGRRVLELACGTGWWTPHGAAQATHWLATDLNPETLTVARAKALPASVELRAADAYTLAGLADDERFDAAFTGCWWSHVPLSRLPGWLDALHARLETGARVVMLDNRYVPGQSTPIARVDAEGNGYQLRPLDDGSTHEVLKNYPDLFRGATVLGPRARNAQWIAGTHYWLLTYMLA